MNQIGTFQDRRVILSLAVTILATAAWLRLYHLGVYSLWLDESHTWLFAISSWGKFLPALRITGVHPPVYFFIERLIVGLLGSGESALRVFSVISDLIAIGLACWLGWEIGKLGGALAAGWFWAFNPFTIWYAQDARPYALVALLSLVILILFRKIQTRQTSAWMVLAGLILALGLLSHFFFFLPLGALILVSLFQMHRYPYLFRRWSSVSIVAILPLALWLVWFFMLPKPSIGIGWIAYPTLADPFLTFWNFLSGYGSVFSIPSTIFGILAGLCLMIGLISGKQALANRHLFIAGIILPLWLCWLISFRRPIYVDRYFIVLLPFLIPAVACGGSQIIAYLQKFVPAPFAVFLLAAVLATFGFFNAWQIHADIKYRREEWQALTEIVHAQASESDPIWFQQPESAIPFEYYFGSSYSPIEAKEPPRCAEPCWWILRQPYTPTHAFTQSVSLPDRPWLPKLPPGCSLVERWDSPTGIGLWKVACP